MGTWQFSVAGVEASFWCGTFAGVTIAVREHLSQSDSSSLSRATLRLLKVTVLLGFCWEVPALTLKWKCWSKIFNWKSQAHVALEQMNCWGIRWPNCFFWGPIHLKDEMPFQAELFRPEGENLACKFVLKTGTNHSSCFLRTKFSRPKLWVTFIYE